MQLRYDTQFGCCLGGRPELDCQSCGGEELMAGEAGRHWRVQAYAHPGYKYQHWEVQRRLSKLNGKSNTGNPGLHPCSQSIETNTPQPSAAALLHQVLSCVTPPPASHRQSNSTTESPLALLSPLLLLLHGQLLPQPTRQRLPLLLTIRMPAPIPTRS